MKNEIKKEGTALTITIEGRLDTVTAPNLQEIVDKNIAGITELTFDLDKLVYISSAGMRVLMGAQKTMFEQGRMELINVSEDVIEVLDMVGLTDVFIIK